MQQNHTKTARQISRINFYFVTAFYSLYDICMVDMRGSKLKNSEKRQIVGAAGISFPLRAADFQFLPAALQAAVTY